MNKKLIYGAVAFIVMVFVLSFYLYRPITSDDSAIATWHNKFGERWSHGCVNLSLENAKKLYEWADIGTPVVVQN